MISIGPSKRRSMMETTLSNELRSLSSNSTSLAMTGNGVRSHSQVAHQESNSAAGESRHAVAGICHRASPDAFEAEAASLFFRLISARYERASVIVTSSKPFGGWSEVFGDPVGAAAVIDRLVHHAVVSLKGDSFRLKDRDLGRRHPQDHIK
jgi:hypothetical protein